MHEEINILSYWVLDEQFMELLEKTNYRKYVMLNMAYVKRPKYLHII